MFAKGPRDQVLIPARVKPKTPKCYLIPPCLALKIIRKWSRVKWSHLGNGVVPSPTQRCNNYWTWIVLVTLDYGRQLYLLTYLLTYLGVSEPFLMPNWSGGWDGRDVNIKDQLYRGVKTEDGKNKLPDLINLFCSPYPQKRIQWFGKNPSCTASATMKDILTWSKINLKTLLVETQLCIYVSGCGFYDWGNIYYFLDEGY